MRTPERSSPQSAATEAPSKSTPLPVLHENTEPRSPISPSPRWRSGSSLWLMSLMSTPERASPSPPPKWDTVRSTRSTTTPITPQRNASPLSSWSKCDSDHTTLFSMSPFVAPHSEASVHSVNHAEAMKDLLTPPDTPPKHDKHSPFLSTPYAPNEPTTWPTVRLPFHMSRGCSTPTHVDEMLIYVHYKDAGARMLRYLLVEAIDEMDTEEEKSGIERMAFLCWPFNVTKDGRWKPVSGLTEGEMKVWKERMEHQGEASGTGDVVWGEDAEA
ncbi:hypothetical protein BDW02DRAFT_27150 [Decorospora gaudefroyi]|uniref:Uncharacterized protein n=1 Tax=Decorospora gaudefroyi TaxID=184978 RepID=A0A6A5K686_9PLEO|nr:hypothetical protein BDW02DRAFT_27150 [Decorospora gaudefroyi]